MGETSLSHLLVTKKRTHNQAGTCCTVISVRDEDTLHFCIDNSSVEGAVIAGIGEHVLAVKLTFHRNVSYKQKLLFCWHKLHQR